MAAFFARIWLSRSVTDPVGLTVAKPFRTLSMRRVYPACWPLLSGTEWPVLMLAGLGSGT